MRFDEVSGCLRTPAGGSSRQTIVLVDKGRVRSRLLSPREAARLMGLPDSYKLPDISFPRIDFGFSAPLAVFNKRRFKSEVQQGSIDGMAE